MPAAHLDWHRAMEAVDVSRRVQGRMGHFLPSPSLFIGPTADGRRGAFFENWLRLRVSLYSAHLGPPTQIKHFQSQEWRDYLGGVGNVAKDTVEGALGGAGAGKRSKAAVRKEAVRLAVEEIFGGGEAANPRLLWDAPLKFCDQGYGSFGDISVLDQREILWEVFEMGFRLELTILDRKLCPGHNLSAATGDAMEVMRRDLVSKVSTYKLEPLRPRLVPDYLMPAGLLAKVPAQRVPSLEAFRTLLSRWPGVPDTIRLQTPLTDSSVSVPTALAVGREMFGFYVQTFFEHSGRAPLVPHVTPYFS